MRVTKDTEDGTVVENTTFSAMRDAIREVSEGYTDDSVTELVGVTIVTWDTVPDEIILVLPNGDSFTIAPPKED
jgi:hypothetical protein